MRSIPVILASFLLTGAAAAQPVQGLYVGAGALWNVKQVEPFDPAPSIALGSGSRLRFNDGGFGGLGSVGWGLGNGLRLEAEASYRQNDIRQFTTAVAGFGESTQQDYGLMLNAFYDVDLRPLAISFVTPYVGVGLGYQWSHLDGLLTIRRNGLVSHIGGTDGGFAYQAIVGAAFPVAPVPGLALTVEYRFLGIDDGPIFEGEAYSGRLRLSSPLKVTQDFNHSIVVGLRYEFGASLPTPAATPSPAAPGRIGLDAFKP